MTAATTASVSLRRHRPMDLAGLERLGYIPLCSEEIEVSEATWELDSDKKIWAIWKKVLYCIQTGLFGGVYFCSFVGTGPYYVGCASFS